MENHPIPQDVTGFKFKLIGSMTVKQFLYVLGFGILATVAFVLHINIFFRIPLMLLFGGIGVALAFIPIEGRPMDIMIANFAKTIPAENRFIFKKRGADIASFEVFRAPAPVVRQAGVASKYVATAAQAQASEASDKRAMLISRLRNSSFRPDEGEVKTLNNIHSLFENDANAKAVPLPIPASDAPSPTEERMKELDKQIAEEKAVKEALEKPQTQAEPKIKVVEAPQPVIKLAGDEAPHEMPITIPSAAPVQQTPNPGLSAGFPTLPDVGNVIMGIVRDARGKSLPNILVEVVDVNNIPVRTFKTNALGQFASATQLSDGNYKVYFEDAAKQHEFKPVDTTLSGQIFQPLEIVSIDAREKLRQELFGGAGIAA